MDINKLLSYIYISCWGQHNFAKKGTILGSIRTITQEAKKEARQMTLFLLSTF